MPAVPVASMRVVAAERLLCPCHPPQAVLFFQGHPLEGLELEVVAADASLAAQAAYLSQVSATGGLLEYY